MIKDNTDNIEIIRARENNLKDVTVSIPKHKLTVVTGVSGSGKSSLIFDTLAAESRRELNRTFPGYVQHYLPKYGRPHVDMIRNLPVTILLEQKKLSDNIRSTVGTYSDVYTFLRLLFSRVGKPFVGYSDVFSFNHPDGRCPKCAGTGIYKELDLHKLVDFNKSLNEDPIDFPAFSGHGWRWKRYAYSGLFDLDKKIKDYSEEELNLFLYSPQIKLKNPPANWPKSAKYEGILPRFQRSIIGTDEGRRYSSYLKNCLHEGVCPECGGTRVNEKIRSCKINGRSIADVTEMQLTDVLEFVRSIDDPLAAEIKSELEKRIGAMIDIGLGYITLGRSSSSLSGGEAQRIKIASHINGSLCDVLYVLDEPSSGLHPYDVSRLSDSILKLLEGGNTVIMVEHNPALIRMADYVVDIGPGAGSEGGRVMYAGPFKDFERAGTATGVYLSKEKEWKEGTRQESGWMEFSGISHHNLKNVSIRIPKDSLSVICGVAGSGKTSLAESMKDELADDAVFISQKNVGISMRSVPATFIGIGDQIRKLFAKANHVKEGWFSFNSLGACPVCKGKGRIVTGMAFLEDVDTPCEKCGGLRYNDQALSYKYKGKNIAEVMDMSVSEAVGFFEDADFLPSIQRLYDVGLQYIHLNQSLSSLSGGELQRLKLARSLEEDSSIYILDEPANGLHPKDISRLLELLNRMVDQGRTVIITEHNLMLMRQADWLVELGPSGGEAGGRILYQGRPAGITSSDESITARFI